MPLVFVLQRVAEMKLLSQGCAFKKDALVKTKKKALVYFYFDNGR